MPSRNAIKEDIAGSYYHIYARGINKQPVFLDDNDYLYFLHLLKRYLAQDGLRDINGVPYPFYGKDIELLCYCLMNNHFHLLVYQIKKGGMSSFMRSLMTSYSKYFNKRHNRTGPLFESRYKAVRVIMQSHLEHISRYIHLNPRSWRRYKYSSIGYYDSTKKTVWVKPNLIISLFENGHDYILFLKDYEAHKLMLQEIKHSLADS